MKRICRHHGISRWPSRKINKVNRSLSKLKHVIESVQGAGALDLTSLAGPLPVALDCVPWPVNLDNLKDVKDGVKERELSPEKSRGSEDRRNKSVSLQVHVEERVHLQMEASRGSHCSTGSSSEGSMDDSPTSQGSCQGSPVNNEIFVSNQQALSDLRQILGIGSSSKFTSQNARDQIPLNGNPLPTAINVEPQPPVGILIKDSASSKDLKNLCTFAAEASQDERGMAATQNTLHPWEMQENRTVAIKASYKEDIIRFRLPHSAGVLAVKDEISKRLKLEVGTFDIKYLDDDHEWVMLACDSDLEECIEISRLSGAHIIRLSVHDIMIHHGSSCGSSEFDHHSYVPRQFNMG
ncbi:hypothetical protein BHE74_00029217 [Ensete ventricosum]|nr:hypothetical protein BHE74_00029217 [Ensete ventricosum]RZS06090.1 hypothetical protein BHM03_00036686 [Ensete ventricosum]